MFGAALLLDYNTARCRAWGTGERLCNTWHGDLLRCLSSEKVGSGRKAGVCFLDNVALLCILDYKASCISPVDLTLTLHLQGFYSGILISRNFWLNCSIFCRQVVHFNFWWWFFCALQKRVQMVVFFTVKDTCFVSNLANFLTFFFPAFWHLFPVSDCRLWSGDPINVFD